ncbi:MAG: hypothetical protein HUU20_21190 [Pirellulales bacterium]|nr:hypothetical protein [Pirellulales bacterium]
MFLDIDGVLNHPACHEDEHALMEPNCVRRLNALVKRTGAVVVIASAWRSLVRDGIMALDGFRWLLRSHGLAVNVVDITGSDEEEPLRGRQFRPWLGKHPQVDGFVVIDDDTESMDDLAQHVVRTDRACGLSDLVLKRAVEILARPPQAIDLVHGRS